MAVLSGGGIVLQKTLKTAGNQMNKVIYNYAYLKYGIILGEATCEELKLKVLNFDEVEKTLIVRGKSLENGLPKSVKIRTTDIQEALSSNFTQIIDNIKEMVEMAPPEVVNEIFNNGIVLTGGLSYIPKIDNYFENELKIKVRTSEFPDLSTINGLIRIGRKKEVINKLKIRLP